jgi:hypothetical protein
MPAVRQLTQDEAKKGFLLALTQGGNINDACEAVNRTRKSYENWRSNDKEFAAAADAARQRREKAIVDGKDPALYNLDFTAWRKRFLGLDTYPHQQMWIDVLEGKTPKVFHDAITYQPNGSGRLVLINTPPFHAKSATITQQWVTYKLCMNPALRVLIISKTGDGPVDGFKPQRGAGVWSAKAIYLSERNLDAEDKAAKDPSIQAVGINGQVYGQRADITILDDAVDDTNADAYEKQFDWLTRSVMSRSKGGKIIVIGTRIKPADLYAHLLVAENYPSGRSPWTYLAQPAVLQFAEDPEDWVTLWPKSSTRMDETDDLPPDENGLYDAWTGPDLEKVRDSNRPGIWALVYQQQQVSEDMTFHPLTVWGCVDRRRKAGPLRAGGLGHPRNGSEGMQIIGSIDPAGTGEAFILVEAVDRVTHERWVMNAWMGNNTKPSWYADRIETITEEYGVREWVIESNAYASWLIHDERIVRYCTTNGLKLSSHFTQFNKQDPDFGVAAMSTLFGQTKRRSDGRGDNGPLEFVKDSNLIQLPDPDWSPGIKALIDQLLIWVPGKRGGKLRQDGPMCLWFAELRARSYLVGGDRPPQHHVENRHLSARARRRQVVVPAGY